jgi:nicotinamidase-related amidase
MADHSLAAPGRRVVERLLPEDEDYFVLKPKHSAFYSTTLDTLLDYLGVRRPVLAGIADNTCVLFTAADAFMSDFELVVPADGVVSVDAEGNRLTFVRLSTDIDLDGLTHRTQLRRSAA